MGQRSHRRTRARAAFGAVLCAAAFAAACTPAPGGTATTTTVATDPTRPTVQSFEVKGGVQPAPALVTLSWKVSDANGDTLTCQIDGDGDGTFELTVEGCQTGGNRNVALATPGPRTATLRVDDGSTAPVTAAVGYSVPAGASDPLDIELRGVSELDPVVADAFQAAEARWEAAIVGGVPDVTFEEQPGCLPGDVDPLPVGEDDLIRVDDVIIDVSTPDLGGVGGILGQAGPTCIPLDSELGFHGIMEFDIADVPEMISDGTLTDVITHEMGHVLGLGTLWDMRWAGPNGDRRLVSGLGTSTPSFVGPRAMAEWHVLGGTGNVPVEGSGGAGTRDSHWRESTFGNELMTGYVQYSANPLSTVSIASMADMGYRVDLDEADPYTVPGFGLLRRLQATPLGEMLRPERGVAPVS